MTGRVVKLPVDDIDTDQIIPARYLKVTDKAGLGAALFADWRGADFPLDQPAARGAEVLVTGRNFGCGSSREHAPWALMGAGFRVVIARSFADIFRGNALKNGLLPVETDLEIADGATVSVDLETQTLMVDDGRRVRFEIDAFSRHCLLNGQDELAYLRSHERKIEEYERKL
jgi:3-isopropylmalate/(R)-2-methylmalate dehydratase small subunit